MRNVINNPITDKHIDITALIDFLYQKIGTLESQQLEAIREKRFSQSEFFGAQHAAYISLIDSLECGNFYKGKPCYYTT